MIIFHRYKEVSLNKSTISSVENEVVIEKLKKYISII